MTAIKDIPSGKICHGTFAALVQIVSTKNFSSLLRKMGVFPEVWVQFVTFKIYKCLYSTNTIECLTICSKRQRCLVNVAHDKAPT